MNEPILQELRLPHERLRWARENAKYGSASLAARAMGVKTATYIAHENGNRSLQKNADRYARFFRVSIDWLLTGRGAPKGTPRVQQIYDNLPPELQKEAIDFLEFLLNKQMNSLPPDTVSDDEVDSAA